MVTVKRHAAHSQAHRRKALTSTHYTDNVELGDLITSWRHARTRMNPARRDRLIAVLYQIAGGVWDRYEFTDHRDDFCQDVLLNFFEKALNSIDVSKNCFSYLTTCAVNFGMRRRHHNIRDRRAEILYGFERITKHFAAC